MNSLNGNILSKLGFGEIRDMSRYPIIECLIIHNDGDIYPHCQHHDGYIETLILYLKKLHLLRTTNQLCIEYDRRTHENLSPDIYPFPIRTEAWLFTRTIFEHCKNHGNSQEFSGWVLTHVL